MLYVKVKSLSRVRLFATPWTVAYRAHQSREFSRQEALERNPKCWLPAPVSRWYKRIQKWLQSAFQSSGGVLAASCPSESLSKIRKWIAISFSRGSSQPRDQTRVSCTAGRRFTTWATGKPKMLYAFRYFLITEASFLFSLKTQVFVVVFREKVFTIPSCLKNNFARWRIPCWKFSFFEHFEIFTNLDAQVAPDLRNPQLLFI